MKKILALFVSMMLVLTLSVAGTAAYAVLDLNGLPTPALDITVTGAVNNKESAPIFNGARWEPGYMQTAYIRINTAAPMMYQIQLDPHNGTEQEPIDQKLAEAIDVYLVDCTNMTTAIDRNLINDLEPIGTLKQIMGQDDLLAKTESDTGKVYAIVLKMHESAGNDYQGSRAGFTVTVRAALKKNNP